MGTLEYVSAQYIAEIDDRTLAHLQIVICNKLRRNERFTLRLASEGTATGPATVLWMASSLPLRFNYAVSAQPVINVAWLHLLADAAASNTGLWIVPEPLPALALAGSPPGHREIVAA